MDTVTTMNTVISQVVEGSRLAAQAGEQMRETQQSTSELVASVRQIAAGSQVRRKSVMLRDRTGQIEESTLKTSQQLEAQDIQTTRLLDYASRSCGRYGCSSCPASQTRWTPRRQRRTQWGR